MMAQVQAGDRAAFPLLVERGNLLESIELLSKRGDPIPVEINTVSLGNGLYQAIVRDITVRKQLEEDLAKQRDRAEEASAVRVAIAAPPGRLSVQSPGP